MARDGHNNRQKACQKLSQTSSSSWTPLWKRRTSGTIPDSPMSWQNYSTGRHKLYLEASGPDEAKDVLKKIGSGFLDFTVEITEMSGNKGMAELRFMMTHEGEYEGIPLTGREVELREPRNGTSQRGKSKNSVIVRIRRNWPNNSEWQKNNLATSMF